MLDQLSAYAEISWQHPIPDRLRTNSFLFSVICLYSTLNVIFSPLSKKREVSATATAIHGCGCISYFLMGNNWLPVISSRNGYPLLTGRVVEWTISVPMFTFMLAQLIDPNTQNVRRAQAKQSMAIIIGGIGPMLQWPFDWACFAVSMYLQILVLFTMHDYLRQMQRSVKRPRDQFMLTFVHIGVIILFLMYPLIWSLGILTQRISPENETLGFAWLDFVTKFMFTSMLCNLTTRAYDFDLVDYSEHFWKFMRVLDVPVFALCRDKRVVYWNPRMEDITEVNSALVLGKPLSTLSSLFSEETRKSLAALVERGIHSPVDAKYEVPVYVGNRPGYTRMVTFSVLSNQLEEVQIPKVVFVGVQKENSDSTAFVQLAYYLHNSQRRLGEATRSNETKEA